MAGERARNFTAYVSLEPCNHVGRQPPCTHALLRHGVRRVVVGAVDPDPRVSGSGIQFLRERGVELSVGVERQLCLDTNAAFIHRILHQRPLSVVAMGVQGELSRVLADCEALTEFCSSPLVWVQSMRETAPEADSVLLDASSSRTLIRHLLSAAEGSFPRHVTVLSLVENVTDGAGLAQELTEVPYSR